MVRVYQYCMSSVLYVYVCVSHGLQCSPWVHCLCLLKLIELLSVVLLHGLRHELLYCVYHCGLGLLTIIIVVLFLKWPLSRIMCGSKLKKN